MTRRRFAYQRPGTLEEALETKASYGGRARWWAGGTDLMVDWRVGRLDAEICIDLTFLSELNYIERRNGTMHIGALATLAKLEAASGDDHVTRVLRDMAVVMCTRQTRTLATVGGNLCNASPAADLPPLLLTFDARAEIVSSAGSRTIPLDEFFIGVKRTALREDELLREIQVPVPERREAAFNRATRTAVDIALVLTAVSMKMNDAGLVEDARVAMGSVAPVPLRSRAAEAVLVGRSLAELGDEAVEEAGRAAASESSPISDVRGSAGYRRAMVEVLVRRSVEQAAARMRRKAS